MSAIENTLPLNVPQGWQPPLNRIVKFQRKTRAEYQEMAVTLQTRNDALSQRNTALQKENETLRQMIGERDRQNGLLLQRLEGYTGDSRFAEKHDSGTL